MRSSGRGLHYENQFSLTDYLDLYKVERATLLNERGTTDYDHKSIATTWSLSFKKIEQDSPASAELLRLCAFVHSDEIPLEIITSGAAELGSILQSVATSDLKLNSTIGESLNTPLYNAMLKRTSPSIVSYRMYSKME